jgi:hypothetical protein
LGKGDKLMKKKKTNKKIASALAMLMLSAAMLGTSTYAWFTMNKTVSVTNMQVKAKADQGLLINEVATATDTHWDEEATTSKAGGIQLHATSTANTGTWYAAYSKKSNTAAAATSSGASADLVDGYHALGTGSYATAVQDVISASAGTSALTQVTYIDKDNNGYQDGEGYYVKYTYYLKSSADAFTPSLAANGESLQIKDVTVTGNSYTGSGSIGDLDAALRVAVVVNSKAYIFAPVSGATTTYYVNGSTETKPLAGNGITDITSIPAVTANGTPVYVYLYFEGEDAKLKTDNVTSTLDNLTVSFNLALVENGSSSVTCNGVSVN